MYNVQTVTEALRGLVGFRDPHDAELDTIDEPLTKSRSGLWLDKAHVLITAKNLNGAAVDLVQSDTIEAYDAFSNPLSRLIGQTLDDSVAAVLSALRTRKLLRLEAQNLLPKTLLFDSEGSLSDLIQPAGRFNVLELTSEDAEVSFGLGSFGIQLTGPAPQLRIWTVFGNGVRKLLKTVATTYTGRMQWFDTDLVMSGETNYKIGYLDADLPVGVQAVRRNKTIGNIACPGCEPANAILWNRWKPFLSVKAARQDAEGLPFDYVANQNFGMNLALSVGCDIGPIMISQQRQLADAIQQQAVVKLLNELAFSKLITTVEQQVRQNSMYALEKTEQPKLEKLLDALDIDFSGLSERCLPPTNANNVIRRKTVFR